MTLQMERHCAGRSERNEDQKLTGGAGATQTQDQDLHGHLAATCPAVDVGVGREDVGEGPGLVLGGVSHCGIKSIVGTGSVEGEDEGEDEDGRDQERQ